MNPLFELLNQPFVLTLLTLTFGGYLANTIADRRARNSKRREKAIDFLAETAGSLNGVVSTMYGSLVTGKAFTHETAVDLLTTLYRGRMGVRIASDAYLRSDSFPGRYDLILHELQSVALSIPTLNQSDQSAAGYQARRAVLRESWPIDNEKPRPEADSPSGELMLWLDMILDRITAMLSSTLKTVMS